MKSWLNYWIHLLYWFLLLAQGFGSSILQSVRKRKKSLLSTEKERKCLLSTEKKDGVSFVQKRGNALQEKYDNLFFV